MRDVFGVELLRVFKTADDKKIMIAAFTKTEAKKLLVNEKYYADGEAFDVISVKGLGHAGKKAKIIKI